MLADSETHLVADDPRHRSPRPPGRRDPRGGTRSGSPPTSGEGCVAGNLERGVPGRIERRGDSCGDAGQADAKQQFEALRAALYSPESSHSSMEEVAARLGPSFHVS